MKLKKSSGAKWQLAIESSYGVRPFFFATAVEMILLPFLIYLAQSCRPRSRVQKEKKRNKRN